MAKPGDRGGTDRRRSNDAIIILLGSVVGAGTSGGDVLMLNLAHRWERSGRTIRILTTVEGARHAGALGIAATSIRTVSSHSRFGVGGSYLLRSLALAKLIRRTVEELGSSVVISGSPYPPDVIPPLSMVHRPGTRWVLSWQLAFPKPWVGYHHANEPQPGRRRPAFRGSLSYIAERSSLWMLRRFGGRVLVPSKGMARAAIDLGWDPSSVHINALGIDRMMIEGAPDGSQRFDAIFLGRFHEQKGLKDLPRIWERVLRQRPEATLAIVGAGEGSITEEVTRSFSEFPDGAVRFFGQVTGPKKYSLLKGATVFVFPSRFESWGHVVLEACAVGLPVVAYDIPSSREVFGDVLAYAPLDDVDTFAARIVDLLENSDTRRALSQAGMQFAERLDWRSIASSTLHWLLDDPDLS